MIGSIVVSVSVRVCVLFCVEVFQYSFYLLSVWLLLLLLLLLLTTSDAFLANYKAANKKKHSRLHNSNVLFDSGGID